MKSFVGKDAVKMRDQITEYIGRNNLPQSVPLLKELNTQIAVAKLLPKLI